MLLHEAPEDSRPGTGAARSVLTDEQVYPPGVRVHANRLRVRRPVAGPVALDVPYATAG